MSAQGNRVLRVRVLGLLLFIMLGFFITACAQALVLNNPYPESQSQDLIYYSSFNEQPKTMDPARSYSSNEYVFIGQIYEPLLGYDYYIRPYQLVPLTATQLPQIKYLDAKGEQLPAESHEAPAFTVYTIQIKPGIFYQPHPALAKTPAGAYRYLDLPTDYLDEHDINKLSDFKYTGTRELIVDDYIYQIKRLANPSVSSPIYGLISGYLVGFKEYARTLPHRALDSTQYLDLRKYPLKGLKKIDNYTFEITLKGQYEQFLFWLAMPFFSPIPWEADLFYSQAEMEENNLNFGWYPIGTGAFMLTENNPNRSMVLKKNPNYHAVYFPGNGTEKDKQKGYMQNVGKRLPLINQAIYTLEKESIPRWNKFLQGYYDSSGITADSFDQAIRINKSGEATLSPDMKNKHIYLTQTSQPNIYYMGFNMLDNTVGGLSERTIKLRQAISIAVNFDEKIAIFFNGRGTPAQGPIPPGIFGSKAGEAGINPIVYKWVNNEPQRRSIVEAKKLMAEAGYPDGIDPATGKALILHYDAMTKGSPEDKSVFDWTRKQFAQLGIDLNVRATLYNRFQEKMRTGNVQIFSWAWDADYPDPENFLFQLYGGNGSVEFGGANSANYKNPEFDRLFELMKNRANDTERLQIIDKMVAIARYDAPWIWGIHPDDFTLSQSWVAKNKPNTMAVGNLQYVSIDITERNKLRKAWNQPVFWPLLVLIFILLALVVPLIIAYWKKERLAAKRVKLK